MRLQRPVSQHVMGRFSRPRGRRLQAALTLVLLLTLAGGVGALALSRQPAAQAEVSADATESYTESYFEGPEFSLTDDGGEHRDPGEGDTGSSPTRGDTEVRTPGTETVQEQHVTDAARPPADEATPPLVVAQAGPGNPADTATVDPPDPRTPDERARDAEAAAERAEKEAEAAERAASDAKHRAWNAKVDALRERKIEQFQSREHNLGVTVSREQAATAVDAGKKAAEPLGEYGMGARGARGSSSTRAYYGAPDNSSPKKADDVGAQGEAALADLQQWTAELGGAVALGFESHQALALTPEAALHTTRATVAISESVHRALDGNEAEAKKLSLIASGNFSEAAKLAVSAGKLTLSPEPADPSEILQRPGVSTVRRAAELSIGIPPKLIEAARLSATAFHPASLFGYPAAVKKALEAAQQAEDAYNELKSKPPLGVQPAAPAGGGRP
jgi:hypothetical protein